MDGQTERRIKDFLEKIPSGVKVVAATKCRSIELVSECPAHGIFAAGENRSAGAFVQIPTRGGAGMAVYRTVADKQSKIHIGQGVFDSVFGQGFAGGQAGGGVQNAA